LTGIGFGLVPALTASASNPIDALGSTRGTASAARQRARGVLVAAEIALATLLLIGASLMLRSFQRVTGVDPGFRPDGLYASGAFLPESRYGTPESMVRFYKALLAELDQLPGAQVAVMTPLPFTGINMSYGFDIVGEPPRPPGHFRVASHHLVSPR